MGSFWSKIWINIITFKQWKIKNSKSTFSRKLMVTIERIHQRYFSNGYIVPYIMQKRDMYQYISMLCETSAEAMCSLFIFYYTHSIAPFSSIFHSSSYFISHDSFSLVFASSGMWHVILWQGQNDSLLWRKDFH